MVNYKDFLQIIRCSGWIEVQIIWMVLFNRKPGCMFIYLVVISSNKHKPNSPLHLTLLYIIQKGNEKNHNSDIQYLLIRSLLMPPMDNNAPLGSNITTGMKQQLNTNDISPRF
jgi:hypothetical protein